MKENNVILFSEYLNESVENIVKYKDIQYSIDDILNQKIVMFGGIDNVIDKIKGNGTYAERETARNIISEIEKSKILNKSQKYIDINNEINQLSTYILSSEKALKKYDIKDRKLAEYFIKLQSLTDMKDKLKKLKQTIKNEK